MLFPLLYSLVLSDKVYFKSLTVLLIYDKKNKNRTEKTGLKKEVSSQIMQCAILRDNSRTISHLYYNVG